MRKDTITFSGAGGTQLHAALWLPEGEVKKAGFEDTTPLVKKLSFETYNQKFALKRKPA